MNTSIIHGSLSAIAQRDGKSLAETYMSADVIVLVDVSGSMASKDSTGGKSRIEVASDELRNLQNSMPGKIAVIAFSDDVEFCPSGIPRFQGCGTDLEAGLRFVKASDIPGMRFILISDGEPADPEAALRVARTFKCKIDVIYVGPEASPTGRDFLYKLAAATGGEGVTADKAQALCAKVQTLLLHS